MRIDGTFRPDRAKLAEITGENGAAKPAPAQADAAATSDPKIAAHLQPYLDKARQAGEVDMEAVRAARKLLDEGRLDTPDAIGRAAQAMVDLDF